MLLVIKPTQTYLWLWAKKNKTIFRSTMATKVFFMVWPLDLYIDHTSVKTTNVKNGRIKPVETRSFSPLWFFPLQPWWSHFDLLYDMSSKLYWALSFESTQIWLWIQVIERRISSYKVSILVFWIQIWESCWQTFKPVTIFILNTILLLAVVHAYVWIWMNVRHSQA